MPLPSLSLPVVSCPAPHTFRKTGEFTGHTQFVLSVSFSPDGERIVSGSADGSVRVWDVRTQKVVSTQRLMSGVLSVAYSPDGKRIVSGSADGYVAVWDARNVEMTRKLTSHTDSVNSITISPDNSMIASGSRDQTVRIWDSGTGQNIHTLTCGGIVRSVAFSPNGRYIVSGMANHGVEVWEVGNGNWQRVHSVVGDARVVAVSPDSNHFAYHCGNNVKIAEIKTGKVFMELQGHTSGVECLSFSPDGTWITSGADDRTIRIWDTSTGNLMLTLTPGAGRYEVRSIAISSDGTKIVACCSNYNIYLFSCDSVE